MAVSPVASRSHSPNRDSDNPFADPPRRDSDTLSTRGTANNNVPAGTAAGAGAGAAAEGSAPANSNEKEQAVKLTATQKIKRHCSKWWWVHLIIGIVLLIILLPLLFLVIIPAIVQDVLNGNKLPVSYGYFQVIDPNTLHLTLNFSIHSPLPVTLEETTMHLYNDGPNGSDGEPYTSFNTSTAAIKGTTQLSVNNQTVHVGDYGNFVKWLNKLFDQPEVPVNIKGRPQIDMGKLHSKPKLDKTIMLPALNYLKGMAIEDIKFLFPADENGNNMEGTLNIPNQSVLGLGLGDLGFNLISGNLALGKITLPNAVLNPGNNTQKFIGHLDFDALTSNIGAVLNAQAAALAHGNIQLNATGSSAVVNGQHIPFLEDVLKQKKLSLDVSAIALALDLGQGLIHMSNHNESMSLGTAIGDVFNNHTLFSSLADHWNTSSGNSASSKDAEKQMKRALKRGMLAWNLMQAVKG